jgi:hypothetical protein
MRSRNIKPGFFKNEYLAECTPLARLLYSGLWCLSDRAGRAEYRPKLIKAEILPYDDVCIEDLLNELLRARFIIVYGIDGQYYLEIPTFTKHQNCHIKEVDSTIPAPDTHGASMIQKLPLTDSLLPLTDSPILIPSTARKQENKMLICKFETFWKAYPKKRNKARAEQAFIKANPNDQLLLDMLSAIERAKNREDWIKEKGKYIPYPSSWISARGWEDEETEVHPLANIVGDAGLRTAATIGHLELQR